MEILNCLTYYPSARKSKLLVQKHFKDKEMAALRAEKAKEANLRRIASVMAREVKNFWGDVNKLFEYRLKVKLDAKKKEALDQHLNYIMDKTEKYSSLLAESLGEHISRAQTRLRLGRPCLNGPWKSISRVFVRVLLGSPDVIVPTALISLHSRPRGRCG